MRGISEELAIDYSGLFGRMGVELQLIKVSSVDTPSLELLRAMNHLVPQLSSSSKPLELGDLQRLIENDCVTLLVASDNETGKILGTLTLVVFPIPTGLRAWIEDVIVDSDARGKGIGKELVRTAVEFAESQGAKSVDLTSRPSRVEANALYLGMGFGLRETNVYRYVWS